MTALTFPSAEFPAFPTISLDAPDDWTGIVVPGTVLAVAAPEIEGEFRPNVVVSVTRFTADYALDLAENAVVEKFAGLEDSHLIGRDRSTIGDLEWAHVESTFLDPRVGTLVQAAHLAVVVHDGVADLIQVTGSVTGLQAKDGVINTLRELQRSVTVRA